MTLISNQDKRHKYKLSGIKIYINPKSMYSNKGDRQMENSVTKSSYSRRLILWTSATWLLKCIISTKNKPLPRGEHWGCCQIGFSPGKSFPRCWRSTWVITCDTGKLCASVLYPSAVCARGIWYTEFSRRQRETGQAVAREGAQEKDTLAWSDLCSQLKAVAAHWTASEMKRVTAVTLHEMISCEAKTLEKSQRTHL